mmetsp:Transcript_11136/g.35488  ORF Transcript_11136/g.35488 Transcript_11136/m.35488 type:complete len:204 (+) Transcript_11136:269-880(+)
MRYGEKQGEVSIPEQIPRLVAVAVQRDRGLGDPQALLGVGCALLRGGADLAQEHGEAAHRPDVAGELKARGEAVVCRGEISVGPVQLSKRVPHAGVGRVELGSAAQQLLCPRVLGRRPEARFPPEHLHCPAAALRRLSRGLECGPSVALGGLRDARRPARPARALRRVAHGARGRQALHAAHGALDRCARPHRRAGPSDSRPT